MVLLPLPAAFQTLMIYIKYRKARLRFDKKISNGRMLISGSGADNVAIIILIHTNRVFICLLIGLYRTVIYRKGNRQTRQA